MVLYYQNKKLIGNQFKIESIINFVTNLLQ